MSFESRLLQKTEPNNQQIQSSARLLVKEGALASVLFSLGTGSFLAGYLAYLGADAPFCALIAALPQLGCVFQLISPFMFERMRYRKGIIIACCFAFRASLPLAMLVPLLINKEDARLGLVFALYTFAFFTAGFVTPGLNRWIMETAPKEARGAYFAKKDITASVVNSVLSLVLGKWLDFNLSRNTPIIGFVTLAIVCLALAALDAAIMLRLAERPAPVSAPPTLQSLLLPLKNSSYRPFIIFMMLWSFSQGLSASFLPSHMVTTLGLSHTFIAGIGIAASACGMCGIWLWGRLADKRNWQRVLWLSGAVVAAVYLLWGFVSPSFARPAALVLQCATGACLGAFNTSSMNLQYFKSPAEGKTLYLGVTAALFNFTYYIAAMLSALIVKAYPVVYGISTVYILLFISGLSMLFVLLTNKRTLLLK